MGLNQGWLKVQLSNSGVSLDNVFIGQVDSSKDLFLDLFDDSIELPQPKVKELLYASISKVYADFLYPSPHYIHLITLAHQSS